MTQHRSKTRAEERIAELDASPKALSAEIEALRQELEAAQQEAAESKAGWQRAVADFANYRRRTDQERDAMIGLANEVLLSKVLAVADDFDRAIAAVPPELQDNSWVDGVAAIDRKLRLVLDSEGITPIEALGKQFDPHEHEAVAQEERPDVAEGTVVSELQRGYRIRDRVLRPAMVAVAKGGTETDSNDTKNFGGIN